jgi:hypothetical protein
MGMPIVYVANEVDLISDAELTAVAKAVVSFATPIGFLPTVQHATKKLSNVRGVIQIATGASKADTEARASLKVQSLFRDIPIGGGSGPGYTVGNLGSLLIQERVFEDLEKWSPRLVKKISITSDLVLDEIQPGELIALNGAPRLRVEY